MSRVRCVRCLDADAGQVDQRSDDRDCGARPTERSNRMSAGHVGILLVCAASLLTVGCGSGDRPFQGEGSVAAPVLSVPSNPPSKPTATPNRFARGLPSSKAHPGVPSLAPTTSGGLAAASIPVVVQLHNLAAALGRPLGLPQGALRHQAADVARRLRALRTKLAVAPIGRPSALASILSGYADLATRIVLRDRPLGSRSRRRLARLDARWRGALRAVGRSSRVNLLAMVPSLPLPNVEAPPLPGHQRAR